MTTIDPTTDLAGGATAGAESQAGPSALERFLSISAGWLTSTDHKKVGRLFIGAGALGLLATIVVNVLWSLERADLANAVDVEAAAQLFDAQRIGMVFGSLAPISIGLCLAIVPLQLGARAVAFGRLAVAGFWMWFGGLVMTLIALGNNGGTLGGESDMVDLFIASLALMALGLAAVAGSVATSVLTTRAPGMTMRRVPFFSMSALITALGLLVVLPVFFGTCVYLFLDHRNAREGFGGNAGIYEWLFWALTQPTTFLLAIPAIGLFAEAAPLLWGRRSPARGVMFAGLALVGVAALSGASQQTVHNVPWAGSELYVGDGEDVAEKIGDLLPWAFFNLLPVLGITIVMLLGLFLARPEKDAKPDVSPAFVFGFLGLGMVLVGMLGNAIYAIDDLSLQGTVFEEASLVYVVYGTTLGVLGGVAHWAPVLWGRSLPTAKVLPLAGLGLLATVLAAFPHYIAGFLDQAGFANLAAIDSDLRIWNVLVLVGHVLMALTVLAFVGLLLSTRSETAADVPAGGHTLEWAAATPALANNFVEPPTVMSAEPILDSEQPGSDE